MKRRKIVIKNRFRKGDSTQRDQVGYQTRYNDYCSTVYDSEGENKIRVSITQSTLFMFLYLSNVFYKRCSNSPV